MLRCPFSLLVGDGATPRPGSSQEVCQLMRDMDEEVMPNKLVKALASKREEMHLKQAKEMGTWHTAYPSVLIGTELADDDGFPS